MGVSLYNDREVLEKDKDKISLLRKSLNDKLEDFRSRERERTLLLDEKERNLESQSALVKSNRAMLEEGMKWVNEQNAKIRHQWRLIQTAKNKLNLSNDGS